MIAKICVLLLSVILQNFVFAVPIEHDDLKSKIKGKIDYVSNWLGLNSLPYEDCGRKMVLFFLF